MTAAVTWLSPVTITVRIPILRRLSKRSRMPVFDDVFQMDDAESAVVLADDERRAALRGDPLRPPRRAVRRDLAALLLIKRLTASAAPLRYACR